MSTAGDCNYSLQDLLPHDHPMILLDAIESVRDRGLTASVTVRPDALFAEPQGVPSWVGIEYMGQAVAAYAGYSARREGRAVRIGFLVGTRRYDPGCSHFPLDATLQVDVEVATPSVGGLQVFDCRITGAGVAVYASLNVFMPENADEFLRGAAN